MNLTEYSQHTRTKLIVFGAPKTGKTALVGKLAATHTLHWFDLENGVKTLLNPEMLDPKFRTNVNVINVPDHRMYPIAIDTVRDVMRGGQKVICQAHGKINCPLCNKSGAPVSKINLHEFTDKDILVIDSLTQLSQSAMNKATLKELMKPTGEDYRPTYGDYSMQAALLDQVLSLIQVLDVNIVVISHETDCETVEGKEKIVPVAGTRNFSRTCAKYFDTVVHCSLVNKTHRAFGSTSYSPTVITGSRSAINIDELKGADLSLASLFNKA
jgi:hypothetical protein